MSRKSKIRYACGSDAAGIARRAQSWRAWAARPAQLAADFASRAAERARPARRTPAVLPQSKVPHRCIRRNRTCRAAVRQKEETREGKGVRREKERRVVWSYWRVRCRLTRPRGRCDAAHTMVDNEFPAAEKILRDIENTVRRNPTIKSFVILPMEDSENRSPVFHQEDSLGLASWCVKPLYMYTYRRLLEYRRTRHQRREEPSTVARWLLGALLFNPSVTTFWNMRRELVRAGRLDPCDELSFTRPVFYHTPKCFQAFSYRSWLMPYVLDVVRTDVAETLANDELEFAQTCADRNANNYPAWSYRRHLVTLFESRGLRRLSFDGEWMNTLIWCRQHVSDHSAYSYRQFLLRKYILAVVSSARETHDNSGYRAIRHDGPFLYMGRHDLDDDERTLLERIREVARLEHDHGYSTTDVRKLRCYLTALSYWTEECLHNEQYITLHDNHETLWCHRRFLAHLIAVLTAAYAKHACYREDDFWDARCQDESSLAPLLRDKRFTTDDDLLMAVHVMLVKSFCSASVGIIEMAIKRPQEKVFIERFYKYLERIGLR